MKNSFTCRIFLCLTMVALLTSTRAQQLKVVLAHTQLHGEKNQIATNYDRSSFSGIPLNELNIHAVRDFMRSFKYAENIQWYKNNNNIIVYFKDNGINTRALYDNRGNWLFTIHTYREDHLPKDIAKQIKRAFYNFSVTMVNEITAEQQTVYLVQLQDTSSCKIIRVCEGEEMQMTEEFVK